MLWGLVFHLRWCWIDLSHVDVNFRFLKKKSSIFSFRRQKANSLTFCAKISSDCRIWPNRHWDRVEWTQEMVFNTYHHTRTCLDKKIEIDEKIFKIIFSLPISLRATLKRSLRSWFSAKNTFSFFIEISVLILKYHQTMGFFFFHFSTFVVNKTTSRQSISKTSQHHDFFSKKHHVITQNLF